VVRELVMYEGRDTTGCQYVLDFVTDRGILTTLLGVSRYFEWAQRSSKELKRGGRDP
jgi:hypothetical protein